jgi:hypothetical protein
MKSTVLQATVNSADELWYVANALLEYILGYLYNLNRVFIE